MKVLLQVARRGIPSLADSGYDVRHQCMPRFWARHGYRRIDVDCVLQVQQRLSGIALQERRIHLRSQQLRLRLIEKDDNDK